MFGTALDGESSKQYGNIFKQPSLAFTWVEFEEKTRNFIFIPF
jgi:hypothetical protein